MHLLFALVRERIPLGIAFRRGSVAKQCRTMLLIRVVHDGLWLHNHYNVPQGDQVLGNACMLWEFKSAVCSCLLTCSVPQGDQDMAEAKAFYTSLIILYKVARAENVTREQ